MKFADLYHAVEHETASNAPTPKPITFEFLRQFVTQDKSLVEQIEVRRVVYDPPIGDARFTLFDERESRYDDPEYYAQISFCASLERDPFFLLFALTKELMHVFDPMDTWINTREKFIAFLRDLQNTPLQLTNGAISAEHKARWMAILALCPETIANYIRASVGTGALQKELAQELGLPGVVIATALDEYYDEALRIMLA